MGNCLKFITPVSDQEDEQNLLDSEIPNNTSNIEARDENENSTRPNVRSSRRNRNSRNNRVLSTNQDNSSSSDESPLFIRMINNNRLFRNRSRSRNHNTTNADDNTGQSSRFSISRFSNSLGRSMRSARARFGAITSSTNNNQSSSRSRSRPRARRSRRSRSRNYNITGTEAGSNADTELTPTENRQILLSQRLGLIQHLPLVSWTGKDQKCKINADVSQNRQYEEAVAAAARKREENKNQSTNKSPPLYTEKPTISSNNLIQSSSAIDSKLKISPPNDDDQNFSRFLESDEKSAESSEKSDETECIICMEEFENGEKIRYLPCMHYYHQNCIDDWLMRSFTCPRCMAAVDSGIMASFAQQLS